MKHWFGVVCFISCLLISPFLADTMAAVTGAPSTNVANVRDAADQQNDSSEEESTHDFPLKIELDPSTRRKLQEPTQSAKSTPVFLWIGNIDRLNDGAAFLSKLPPNIGILINPFDALPKNVLDLIAKQKRELALVIPTRSRFDGEVGSAATLNASQESRDYFEQIVVNTKIKTIFIPDMVDIDQEVIEFIIALAKLYKLTLVIPPQVFNNIQILCQTQAIPYHLLDTFVPSATTFDNFKDILAESIQIMNAFDELKMVVCVTDEQKMNQLNEHIQLIQSNNGLFVDAKPMIQAK